MDDRTTQFDSAADAGDAPVSIAQTPANRSRRGSTGMTRDTRRSDQRPARRDPVDDADARDMSLVAAWRAGDEAALAELLDGYRDRLFGVCVRMVNDHDVAADMTQEAMVKIIHGLPRFSGRSKLSTWMIRVTMNVCLTWRRKQRLRRHASLDSIRVGGSDAAGGGGDSLASMLPDEREPGAEGRVEQIEIRQRLRQAMEQIEPQQRAILILRDVQGFDYREIASILAIPEGTVKSRLFRARVALRESMERLRTNRSGENESRGSSRRASGEVAGGAVS